MIVVAVQFMYSTHYLNSICLGKRGNRSPDLSVCGAYLNRNQVLLLLLLLLAVGVPWLTACHCLIFIVVEENHDSIQIVSSFFFFLFFFGVLITYYVILLSPSFSIFLWLISFASSLSFPTQRLPVGCYWSTSGLSVKWKRQILSFADVIIVGELLWTNRKKINRSSICHESFG